MLLIYDICNLSISNLYDSREYLPKKIGQSETIGRDILFISTN